LSSPIPSGIIGGIKTRFGTNGGTKTVFEQPKGSLWDKGKDGWGGERTDLHREWEYILVCEFGFEMV
jgi:hypothetical protein